MDALRESLATLTESLCAIPSVTGQEEALCDHVAAEMRHLGFLVDRRGNAIATRRPNQRGPLVLLAGHLDTVPPNPHSGPPRREGGRIHALGASDMKAGLAVMLHLAATLDAEQCNYNVGYLFYDREEGPFDENGLEPLLAALPWLREASLAIFPEPTENRVEPGCMGSIHARIVFRGRACHSGRPWLGDNAIHKAAPFLALLAERGVEPVEVQGLRFRESMSATIAQGGRARNVIPETFELNLNYRFAPTRSVAEAVARVHERVGDAAEVQIVDRSPAGPVHLGHPLLQRLVRAAGGQVSVKEAWTDVARMATYGIPAVNLGPGRPEQAHQADEHVEIGRLTEGFDVLWSFLTEEPG